MNGNGNGLIYLADRAFHQNRLSVHRVHLVCSIVLFLELSIIHLSLHTSGSILCPENNVKWKEREIQLNCVSAVNGTYHCIKLLNGTLTETCMAPSLIDSSEAGCPRIVFMGVKPVLSRPFEACGSHLGDCPETNHRFYYTDELYKYEYCIRSAGGVDGDEDNVAMRENVTENTTPTPTTSCISFNAKTFSGVNNSDRLPCTTSSLPNEKAVCELSSLVKATLCVLCILTVLVLLVHRLRIVDDFLKLKDLCCKKKAQQSDNNYLPTPVNEASQV